MLSEFVPLPVRCELANDESGYGFLLRAARANGVTLAQLMTYAGTRSLRCPLAQDIEALAFLTGAQTSVLASCLRQKLSRRQEIFYRGRRWRGSEAFRVKAPQVCPLCLREAGRCLAVWELSAYCICTKHFRCMVDSCAHCKKPLNWFRPAIDICACGRYLASLPDEDKSGLDANLLALCHWLEGDADPLAVRANGSQVLPHWLVDLGADGAFHVLRALGWRTREGQRISAAEATRTLSPREMVACLARAFARVDDMQRESALPRELASLIDEARIERLAQHGATEAARRFARQLLKRMLRQAPMEQIRRPWRASRPARGQLELFDNA